MIKQNQENGDFNNLLHNICKSAAELLHASASSIYLKHGNKLIMHAAYGYSETLVHKAEYLIGEGITGWIAEGNQFIANSKEEISSHMNHIGKYDKEIWKDGSLNCHSMIGIPLLIGEDVYGLIKVENKCINNECGLFDKEDLEKLKIFLGALSNALQQNKEMWSTLGKHFLFVLIPFCPEFNNIYDTIKQAAENIDLFCFKVNDEPFVGKISSKIYESINRADIIVSVLTGKNPNVFYETGYSHAKEKPTILLIDNPSEIPFDLKDYNHIIYNSNQLADLRENLRKYLKVVLSQLVSK